MLELSTQLKRFAHMFEQNKHTEATTTKTTTRDITQKNQVQLAVSIQGQSTQHNRKI